MADFSIVKILNKISEYDQIDKDNKDIETLVKYNFLGKQAQANTVEPQEDIVKTCSNIKEYLNKILKTN